MNYQKLDYMVICEKDCFVISADSHILAMDTIYLVRLSDVAEFNEKYGEIKKVYCLGGKIYEK